MLEAPTLMSDSEICSASAIEQLLGGPPAIAVVYGDLRESYEAGCTPFKKTLQDPIPFDGYVATRAGYVGRFEGSSQGTRLVVHCIGPYMGKPFSDVDSSIVSWEFYEDSAGISGGDPPTRLVSAIAENMELGSKAILLSLLFVLACLGEWFFVVPA